MSRNEWFCIRDSYYIELNMSRNELFCIYIQICQEMNGFVLDIYYIDSDMSRNELFCIRHLLYRFRYVKE